VSLPVRTRNGYLLKTSRAESVAEAILEAAQGGSPMSPKVAASVVKMLANLTKPAAEPISLSPREHDLLRLIVEGLTAKEIADRMQVSIHNQT
jgi:DNA-binding NarL/FixJ family response regulator